MSDWSRVRLHVVTGKGGTGKSTVAASLALALASQGKNVLLCEVEGRQGIARMFDVDPLPYAERRIATGLRTDGRARGRARAAHRGRGRAAGVPLDVLQARPGRPGPRPVRGRRVRDHHRAGRARRAAHRQGLRGGAAQQPQQGGDRSTTPSCSTRRRPAGSPSSSTSATSWPGWPRSGRSRTQADTMMTLFRSPRTAVHLVTVLEEMPVQETADGIAHLRDAGLPVGGVVVNQVRPARPAGQGPRRRPQGRAGPAAIGADLVAAGVDVRTRLLDGLLAEARDHADAGRWRTPSASCQGAGRPDVRAVPAGRAASTWAASTSWPAACRTRAWHDPSHAPSSRPARGAHRRARRRSTSTR